ncbi:hypothetical protein AAG570_001239 [Ranatra chinensis]|uniref:Uncharacterized protein n=1 Tax=Ranatra chinensis TaxID=642074 RepID=A0ABD0YBA7_9HEMI
MEEEAGWLSKREELQKELSDSIARLELRKEKLQRLQKPSERLNNHLEVERIGHMRSIEEGRNRLKLINAELQNLSKASAEPPLNDNCESITDEENNRKCSTSQDDLDRISRVTTDAPIDMSCNTLGKRTIASLQEIERNRHLHLAKQGSLVIQEERQRVEELKRRVQDEVRAQWQQQRNSNCQSITSDSSSNSIEPTHDR